jgi:hypothetical protein
MTESVFLNKVDIIVKQQRLTQEEGETEDDWHYSRKGERSAPQSRKFGAERSRTAREKYNFLEDVNRKHFSIKSYKEHLSLEGMMPPERDLNNTKKKLKEGRKDNLGMLKKIK